MQTKKDEHPLKKRNVPTLDSTDSEDNEKPTTQSLETIVANANSAEPDVQLGAVQAARWRYILNIKCVSLFCVGNSDTISK